VFQTGPYFMTKEDQNAAIGKMVTRFSEAKTRRVALMSEATEIGKGLVETGRALEGIYSVKAFFDGDARRGDYSNKPDLLPFKPYPDADRINKLVNEIRTVSAEIRQLRVNLSDAGLNVD
jgi:hypothetical protein